MAFATFICTPNASPRTPSADATGTTHDVLEGELAFSAYRSAVTVDTGSTSGRIVRVPVPRKPPWSRTNLLTHGGRAPRSSGTGGRISATIPTMSPTPSCWLPAPNEISTLLGAADAGAVIVRADSTKLPASTWTV